MGRRGKKQRSINRESSDRIDRGQKFCGEKIEILEEDRAASPIRRIARFCIASKIQREEGEVSPRHSTRTQERDGFGFCRAA